MYYLTVPVDEESRHGHGGVPRLWFPRGCHLGIGQGYQHLKTWCKWLLAGLSSSWAVAHRFPSVSCNSQRGSWLHQSKQVWTRQKSVFYFHLILDVTSCHSCHALFIRNVQLTLKGKGSYRSKNTRRVGSSGAMVEGSYHAGRHRPCRRRQKRQSGVASYPSSSFLSPSHLLQAPTGQESLGNAVPWKCSSTYSRAGQGQGWVSDQTGYWPA